MGSERKEIYNHFEFHKELTTKSGLLRSLRKHCAQNQLDPFQVTPTAFSLNLDDAKHYQQELATFL